MRLGSRRRRERDRQRSALARARTLCEEDVTVLGEQLRRLDTESAERPLDEAARIDYQAALDAYEAAGRLLVKAADLESVVAVTETLNDGRYALACVQARVAGEPRPEKRVPCFFNPQHGPSVTDVMFTPRAAGTRRVAACAQDAARVKAGERPEVRKVEVNGRKIDYFDASQVGRVYGEPAAMNALLAAEINRGQLGDMGSPF